MNLVFLHLHYQTWQLSHNHRLEDHRSERKNNVLITEKIEKSLNVKNDSNFKIQKLYSPVLPQLDQ